MLQLGLLKNTLAGPLFTSSFNIPCLLFNIQKAASLRPFECIVSITDYCSEVFTNPSFASRLSVACGTARKRALSISFPVTRQIP